MSSDPQHTDAPAASRSRAALPRVARLDIHRERVEQMWQLTPAQRIRAAYRGSFTLGEMLRWAARAPHEIPLVDGEFFFIRYFETDDDGDV
jgi:hypothetical protein